MTIESELLLSVRLSLICHYEAVEMKGYRAISSEPLLPVPRLAGKRNLFDFCGLP